MELDVDSLYLVGNIPGAFHSSDLRAFFSQFVEKGNFVCFHYRHRPEYQSSVTQVDINDSSSSQTTASQREAKTHCCVVAVSSGQVGREFLKHYHNKNWSRSDGELLGQKVRITKLKVAGHADSSTSRKHTTEESQASTSHTQDTAIPWSDLQSLPELNPPSAMPQGNVGTPLSTFMALIRTCKLPSHVIKKLQLEFPKSRSKKRYGAVSLDYGTTTEAVSVMGEGAVSSDEDNDSGDGDGGHNKLNEKQPDSVTERDEEEEIPPDDDHDAEEWERYEAFHEDVDKQERTTERLFEEELEVVWDKGSSGLVFYTDASYWDQQDGDFDEKCSKEDDWNVDMSVYYVPGGGDKDARDLRDMQMERTLREAVDVDTSATWTGIGGFERHTKGIGARVLKKSGWREGRGVGASNQGIAEPVETEGQHPHVKRGLGYRGEKLDRNVPSRKRRKRTQDVIISTVYDTPAEEEDTVLRTAPSTTIKYRTEHVKFLGGGVLKPNIDSDQSAAHKHR